MESHCNFVWEKYVIPSKFKKLYVIAHSAGGMCLSAIQKKFAKDFYTRVQKIALTDSYATPLSQLTPDQRKWMWKNAVHFKPVKNLQARSSAKILIKTPALGNQRDIRNMSLPQATHSMSYASTLNYFD